MEPILYERFYNIEEWFWWSVGTRRVFFDLIKGVRAAGRVIDVGCGTGIMLAEFPPQWTTIGCDASALALKYTHRRGVRDVVRCIGTGLPFVSESADLVLALDVIEHLDDDAACLREMARICRDGGYALIHVPAFEILWTEKDDVSYHKRRYRRAQLHALVERCGFAVEVMFHINALLFPVALARAGLERVTAGFRTRRADADTATEGLYHVPGLVNRMMIFLMDVEHRLFGRGAPFGMSLVCLARKRAP